jgi:hypothetical protein
MIPKFGSQSLEQLQSFKSSLQKFFPMKDLGVLTSYLGMEVVRDFDQHTVSLSQHKYIQELLERFSVQDCKPAYTPLPTVTDLECETDPQVIPVL